jgi:nucleoside 2-deoxyribosyltransferase
MKLKIYLSGPLFSQGEIEWAGNVKDFLHERLGDGIELVWPHEIASGSSREIFFANLRALKECGLMVALLDGPQVDDGTAWEVGFFYARGGKVLGIRTDFRKAGESSDSQVNAMVEFSCLAIVGSLEDLVREIEKVLA